MKYMGKNMKNRFLLILLLFGLCAGLYAQSTAAEIETLLATEAVTYAAASRFVLEASEKMVTYNPQEAFQFAAERKWLPGKVSENQTARLDGISLLVLNAFDIKGGLFYTLTKNAHYAYREMTYRNYIQGRVDPAMNVSGELLLFMISRILGDRDKGSDQSDALAVARARDNTGDDALIAERAAREDALRRQEAQLAEQAAADEIRRQEALAAAAREEAERIEAELAAEEEAARREADLAAAREDAARSAAELADARDEAARREAMERAAREEAARRAAELSDANTRDEAARREAMERAAREEAARRAAELADTAARDEAVRREAVERAAREEAARREAAAREAAARDAAARDAAAREAAARQDGKFYLIIFSADSTELRDSEKAKLQVIADVLRGIPDAKIVISGHAALAGTKEGQNAVASGRARNVRDYLISLGAVKAANVTAVGYGAERPIASNSTSEGMAANRRVEITILED